MPKLAIQFIILAAATAHLLPSEPLNQHDREHLLAHLQMTGSWLPDEVSSLSVAQLNYRGAPDKWTVAEVVQHLVIAEPNYWKLFQEGMSHSPEAPKSKASDADVLWYGIDRTRRDKTPARQDPRGQQVNIAEALASFRQLHSKLVQYATTTNDDLRAHAVPAWGVDAYQCLLEISTHEQRHILQIREIKSDPNFPTR